MKQISVTDSVDVPDGVRVMRTAPDTIDHVNLYKEQSGRWCAEHWMRHDGQFIASYSTSRTSKGRALQDAFRMASVEDIPFVDTVNEERDAMYVESTVVG